MQITGIQPVTKQKYRVVIDGEPAFVLYRGELSRYGLREGEELSEEIYEELTEEVLNKRARLRAMHLLERGDRTEAELRRKLEQSEYPEMVIEKAIAYVKSYRYLDDRRYAANYVEFGKKGKGKARLRMELIQKGIDRTLIEETLDGADFCNEKEQIRELAEKKRRGNGSLNEKEKQRIYGYLMRKGFSSSDILSVLKEMN